MFDFHIKHRKYNISIINLTNKLAKILNIECNLGFIEYTLIIQSLPRFYGPYPYVSPDSLCGLHGSDGCS